MYGSHERAICSSEDPCEMPGPKSLSNIWQISAAPPTKPIYVYLFILYLRLRKYGFTCCRQLTHLANWCLTILKLYFNLATQRP